MNQPSRDLARSDNESSVDGSKSVFIPSSNTSFRHSFLPLLAPAGLLERSSNFRPETCTTRTGWSTLLHSYSREIASFEYTRILQFGFSYYKRPGEWIRFTLRITASIESKYWRFERKKTIGLNDTYSHEFPSSLMSKLASYLTDCEDLEQGSQLTVYLGKDLPEPDKGRDPMVLAIQRGRPPSQVNQYLQTITSMIYHWSDCPRYSDKALVQRPMSRHRPTNSFFAFLDERWVLASRFGCDESHIDRDRYILRALHQLRRAPGITPFLGVIFDHDSGVVTAYLCELPAKGRLSRIMADAIQSGQPITWARRERWCRQIVQGVAEMHDNDFVVGYLGEQPDAGIGIDANDNAVFFGRFQQTFWYERYGSGRLPPEYKDVKCPTEEMVATPEADIYQMGSLLWGLAVNKNGVHQTDFCKRAGCASKAGTVCSEPHADPVQLPSLGEHIPQYLNDVIAGCRHAQPRSRLPARKLYEMFPTPAEVPESQDAVEERLLRRPEECTDKYDLLVVCNLCDGKATHHYFNCDVCESSNYDLCQPCFSKGLHCLNTDHQLREHSDFHDEERYHSSVKENGQRELITACRARVDAKESGWTSR